MSSPATTATATATTNELQSSLRDLSISEPTPIKDIPRPALQTQPQATKPKPKQKPVADSWEDELGSSSSSDEEEEEEEEADDKPQPQKLREQCRNDSPVLSPSVSVNAEGPLDPPPTPISPQTSNPWTAAKPTSSGSSPGSSTPRSVPERRPEKQTAVAGRMIAGALGIRAPKRTPEQRAYDRSVKEQEIRRRNREKELATKAKQEEEKAKAAVWDE